MEFTHAQSPNKRIDMPHRQLGNLSVSIIGCGCASFGSVYNAMSVDDCIAVTRECFDNGINLFDTSPYYGHTLSGEFQTN
jgi:L-galactose dehydrogenase